MKTSLNSSYSLIHNMDTSLRYDVYLDDTIVRSSVPPHHVESIVYELEMQGENIVDELWDDDLMRIDLTSTSLLDDEE